MAGLLPSLSQLFSDVLAQVQGMIDGGVQRHVDSPWHAYVPPATGGGVMAPVAQQGWGGTHTATGGLDWLLSANTSWASPGGIWTVANGQPLVPGNALPPGDVGGTVVYTSEAGWYLVTALVSTSTPDTTVNANTWVYVATYDSVTGYDLAANGPGMNAAMPTGARGGVVNITKVVYVPAGGGMCIVGSSSSPNTTTVSFGCDELSIVQVRAQAVGG